MADELIQQLGFDASKALEALEAINSGFTGFEQRLKSVGDAMATWNAQAAPTIQLLKDIASNATTAAGAMAKLTSAFGAQQTKPVATGGPAGPNQSVAGAGFPAAAQQVAQQVQANLAPVQVPVVPAINPAPINNSTAAVSNFVMSWETLGRVVSTQLIVRAMSQARDAIHEAYLEHVKFVKQLSEVRSISPERDLGAMTKQVANLSREFDVPLEQVVEAKYQAISSQFVSTAQQTEILTAAARASKVGLVDMGKAAEIVSGALNVYGKDANEAEVVTAKMFKAVSEGHLRFADLSNIISRVGPTARELGVSFDELLAAVDALSIGGMKPAEVATSIRASMTALFKPSRDLREELAGLTSEQLIAVNGLVGAWTKLRGDTNGTMAELGKLVGNIRGMNAVLRETGTGAEAFAKSLKAIKEAGSGAEFGARIAEFESTDVEKLNKEMNKLHVFFATELGADIVKLMTQFAGLTGGSGTLITVMKGLEPVVVAASAAFVVLGARLMFVRANAILAANGMGQLASVVSSLMLVALAYGGGKMIGERFVEQQREAMTRLSELEKAANEKARAADQAALAAKKDANDQIVRDAVTAVTKVGDAYRQQVQQGKEANQQWLESTKVAMEALVSARERGVRLLRDLVSESNREIENSQKRSADILGRLDDTRYRFRETQERGWQEQTQDYARRAVQLAQQAQAALSQAQTPGGLDAAQSIYKRAEAYAQESMASAQRYGDIQAQEDAERAIEWVMRSQLSAEQQLQTLKRQTATEAAKTAAAEEAKVRRMKELLKDILKEGDLFGSKGQPLSDAKREANLTKMREDMAEFQRLAFAGGQWNMSDLLNFAGFKQKMESAFRESVTDLQIAQVRMAPETLATLSRQITQGVGIVDVLVRLVPDAARLKGLTAEQQIIEATRQIQAQSTEVDRLNQKKAETLKLDRDATSAAREVVATLRGADTVTAKGMSVLGAVFNGKPMASVDTIQAEYGKVAGLRADVEKAATDADFTMKKYEALAARALAGYQSSSNRTVVQYEVLSRALLKLREIAQIHEELQKVQGPGNLDAQIKAAQDKLNSLKQGAVPAEQAVQGVTDKVSAVEQATDNLSLGNYLFEIQLAIFAMDQLAWAAASVPAPGGDAGMYSAKGGMAFLAGGGSPRGTDVIPAMLSRGEMVMNAATTRRFASQLVALNAGVKPVFHSQGGQVTNVGDIYVTVQGGKSGQQTARTMATELRRELRRGTSIL